MPEAPEHQDSTLRPAGTLKSRKLQITVEFDTHSAAPVGVLTDHAITELSRVAKNLTVIPLNGFRGYRIVSVHAEEDR